MSRHPIGVGEMLAFGDGPGYTPSPQVVIQPVPVPAPSQTPPPAPPLIYRSPSQVLAPYAKAAQQGARTAYSVVAQALTPTSPQVYAPPASAAPVASAAQPITVGPTVATPTDTITAPAAVPFTVPPPVEPTLPPPPQPVDLEITPTMDAESERKYQADIEAADLAIRRQVFQVRDAWTGVLRGSFMSATPEQKARYQQLLAEAQERLRKHYIELTQARRRTEAEKVQHERTEREARRQWAIEREQATAEAQEMEAERQASSARLDAELKARDAKYEQEQEQLKQTLEAASVRFAPERERIRRSEAESHLTAEWARTLEQAREGRAQPPVPTSYSAADVIAAQMTAGEPWAGHQPVAGKWLLGAASLIGIGPGNQAYRKVLSQGGTEGEAQRAGTTATVLADKGYSEQQISWAVSEQLGPDFVARATAKQANAQLPPSITGDARKAAVQAAADTARQIASSPEFRAEVEAAARRGADVGSFIKQYMANDVMVNATLAAAPAMAKSEAKAAAAAMLPKDMLPDSAQARVVNQIAAAAEQVARTPEFQAAVATAASLKQDVPTVVKQYLEKATAAQVPAILAPEVAKLLPPNFVNSMKPETRAEFEANLQDMIRVDMERPAGAQTAAKTYIQNVLQKTVEQYGRLTEADVDKAMGAQQYGVPATRAVAMFKQFKEKAEGVGRLMQPAFEGPPTEEEGLLRAQHAAIVAEGKALAQFQIANTVMPRLSSYGESREDLVQFGKMLSDSLSATATRLIQTTAGSSDPWENATGVPLTKERIAYQEYQARMMVKGRATEPGRAAAVRDGVQALAAAVAKAQAQYESTPQGSDEMLRGMDVVASQAKDQAKASFVRFVQNNAADVVRSGAAADPQVARLIRYYGLKLPKVAAAQPAARSTSRNLEGFLDDFSVGWEF